MTIEIREPLSILEGDGSYTGTSPVVSAAYFSMKSITECWKWIRHLTFTFLQAIAHKSAQRAWLALESKKPRVVNERENEAIALNQLLLENSVSAHFVVSNDCIIEYVNQGGLDIFGYTQEEMLGSSIHDLLHYSLSDGTPCTADESPIVAAWREGRKLIGHKEVFWRKDGTPVLTVFNMTPRMIKGKPAGAVLSMQDLFLAQEHIQKLQAAESRFRSLCDSNVVAIGIFKKDGTWVYANDKLLSMSGYSRDDMKMGIMNWTEMTPQECILVDETYLAQADEQDAAVSYEKDYIRKDGHRINVLIGYARLDWVDEQYICVIQDLTEQKKHKAELIDAIKKAEAASEAKSQFLAILSHEMRTPLTPCLLTASSRAMDPSVPLLLRQDFANIQRLLELEARLIDDLLDVMLIVRGKLSFHMTVIDAHHKIHLASDICRPDVLDKQIELVLDLQANQHHVTADAARFQQVIWNLIKNAVKFTPHGGKVTVTTRNEGDNFILDVQDTGIGIKVDVLPTIFDAFIQGERNKGRKYGGLGLGLAISRAIVEGHKGTIEVCSGGENQGSRFVVVLPTALIPKMPSFQNEKDASSGGYKVFYVEDDEATRDVITMLLKINGYDITAASGLATALEVDPEPFDILISDIGLGDGTGLDLMSSIRCRGYNLPGIAVSGYSTEEDVQESLSVGFSEHLSKPLDFSRLDAAIRRVVRRRTE